MTNKSELLNKTLKDMLGEIKDERKDIFIKIYDDFADIFHTAKGSSVKHHAWKGGYADHLAECLRINRAIYQALSDIRELDFNMDSADIALFFHDIEKPFKYGPKDDPKCKKWQDKLGTDSKAWHKAQWQIINSLKDEYGFYLTDEEVNAIKYTHGEGDDYKPDVRVANSLAAHIHHCDNISARIWYNDGKNL